MNKITNILLGSLLLVSIVSVVVVSLKSVKITESADQNKIEVSLPESVLGSTENDLGASMTQASTSIPTSVQVLLASTTNEIFAADSSIKYRRIEVASGTVFILFDNATTALSSSTVGNTLLELNAGESYTIDLDNRYWGRVMGVSPDTTGADIKTIQK